MLGSRLIVAGREVLPEEETGETTAEEPEWVEIGRDGAAAYRCGPAVGRAVVGVRYIFDEPGDYLVRATVDTVALAGEGLDPTSLPESLTACDALAHDDIFVGVRVLDPNVDPDDIADDDVEWEDVPEQPTEPYALQLQNQLMNMAGPRN